MSTRTRRAKRAVRRAAPVTLGALTAFVLAAGAVYAASGHA